MDSSYVDLVEGQLFSDAELDVFCSNMLQAENLTTMELTDLFDADEDAPAAGAASQQAPAWSGDASGSGPLNPAWSEAASAGSGGSPYGPNDSRVPAAPQQQFSQPQSAGVPTSAGVSQDWTPHNQQQQYQHLHGLPAISTVMYAPTGPGTHGRVIDMPPAAAESRSLQNIGSGSGRVEVVHGGVPALMGGTGVSSTGTQVFPASSGEMGRPSDSVNGAADLSLRDMQQQPQQHQQQASLNGSGGGAPGLVHDCSTSAAQRAQQAADASAAVALTPSQAKQMKEKHRSAQRRYRARLRAKQEEDHAKVEELTRELDRMKAQQNALLEKNAALQRKISRQGAGDESPSASTEKAASSGAGSGSQEASTDAAADGAPSLRNRYRLNDQTWDLIKDSIGSPDDRLTFTVREEPITVSKRDVSNWTPEKYKDLWKDYVNAFALCLMQCQGETSHPAHTRLMELLGETRALKLTFCMLRPDLLAIFAVDAVEKRGMPTAAFWKGVAESLTITTDQLRKMISVRNQALKNLGAMMAQRRELLHRLSRGTDLTSELQQMSTIDYLQTRPAALQMDALLRNENSFIAELSTVVMAGVLTPLQLAHVITLAWPFGVNILAIMNVLADKAGAPPVADLLRQGAANGGQLSPLREALMAA